MPTPRRYGSTDIFINPLGLGDAQIGDAEVGILINAAVDAGINLLDTAPSYGLSEERIGRHLATRRSEIVLQPSWATVLRALRTGRGLASRRVLNRP